MTLTRPPGRIARKMVGYAANSPSGSMPTFRYVVGNAAMDALLGERKSLLARIEQEREQLEQLQAIAERLSDRLAHDERTLEEIESVLGKSPQLRIEDAN